jgi:hypothetical protein
MTEKILSLWYWLEDWSLICFGVWALFAGLDWLFDEKCQQIRAEYGKRTYGRP